MILGDAHLIVIDDDNSAPSNISPVCTHEFFFWIFFSLWLIQDEQIFSYGCKKLVQMSTSYIAHIGVGNK